MSNQPANGTIAVAVIAVLMTAGTLQLAPKAPLRPTEPSQPATTGEYVSPFVQVPFRSNKSIRDELPAIAFHYNPSTEFAHFRGRSLGDQFKHLPKPVLNARKIEQLLAGRTTHVVHFDGILIDAGAMRYISENCSVREISFRRCIVRKSTIDAMAGCKHLTDLFTFDSFENEINATDLCQIRSLRKIELLESVELVDSLPLLHNCLPDAVITP